MKGKIIAGLIIAALAGLYALSPEFRKLVRFGWDTAQNARYELSRGSGSGTRTAAQIDQLAQQCRDRMTAMEHAKLAVLQQSPAGQGTVSLSDIARRLGTTPDRLVCPETGNVYMIGSLVDPVSCQMGNHGSPTYDADDHIIRP